MIRLASRASGALSLASAFAMLVVDGSRSIAGGRILQYSLGDAAAWLGGARLGAELGRLAGEAGSARTVAAALLAVPAWLAAAVFGLALLYAGRPARGARRHGSS